MKKIIFVIGVMFIFIINGKCESVEIINYEIIDNVNFSLESEENTYYFSAKYYTINNGTFIYNINVDADIESGYESLEYYYSEYIRKNEELSFNCQKIMYFGYTYDKDDTINEYIATQYLLYEILYPNYSIKIVNNDGIELVYTSIINKIRDRVKIYDAVPSFIDKTFDIYYQDSIIIEDTNNIKGFNLQGYSTKGVLGTYISEGLYNISGLDYGYYSMRDSRTLSRFNYGARVFLYNKVYSFVLPGTLGYQSRYVNFNVIGGDLVINNPNSDSVYQLFNDYYQTEFSLVNGTYKLDNIKYDTYYLKEISCDDEVIKDDEVSEIIINKENKHAIMNKLSKKKTYDVRINIYEERYFIDSNELKYYKLNNIKIDVYDDKNNLLFSEIGDELSLNLNKGKYIIKYLDKEKVINVGRNETFNFNNYIEKGNIEVSFKYDDKYITDINFELFLNDEKIDEGVSRSNNNVFYDLPIDEEYYIKEISAPAGIDIDKKLKKVSVDTNTIDKAIYRGKLIIHVNNISNYVINIYALEDIYDYNNELIYMKDDLVESIETNNDILESKELILGKYYVCLGTDKKCIFDYNYYEFYLNDNLLVYEITIDMKDTTNNNKKIRNKINSDKEVIKEIINTNDIEPKEDINKHIELLNKDISNNITNNDYKSVMIGLSLIIIITISIVLIVKYH